MSARAAETTTTAGSGKHSNKKQAVRKPVSPR
jgi:hypothetical protein